MAQVNAEINITADASKATKAVGEVTDGLDKMNKAADRAQKAAESATGGGGNGGGGSPPEGPGGDPESVGRRMGEAFARVVGSSLSKFIVSFMANQGASTMFALMRRPGEDSRRIDQAEATVQGAITWGGAGASVAGPLGAVVGGILGGLNSFVLKQKEISDALAKSRIDYDRERGAARIGSARSQEETWFNFELGMLTPEQKAKRLQERAKELQGSGTDDGAFARAYEERMARVAYESRRVVGGSGSIYLGGGGASARSFADDERIVAMKGQNRSDRELLERAIDAIVKGDLANAPEIGGNKVGTANWYREAWEGAKIIHGIDDERTAKVKTQLDATNSLIDPLKNQELGVYIGQLEQLMGFAGRSAITDSAASKGLGVGAQIGAMGNDRMLNVVQDILKAVRGGNKDVVDMIRERGGVGGLLAL